MLPNFLVIGAKKSGTTSLHRYLSAHPQVWLPPGKRIEFFSTDRWERGSGWYASQFDRAGDCLARGEISTSYTRLPLGPDVAARVHQVVPDVRLVYIMRHPLKRIVSHYREALTEGWERRPIDEAVFARPEVYVARSRYHMQLAPYLAHFSRDQLLLLRSENLRDDRFATLGRVYAFLGVDPCRLGSSLQQVHNRTRDLRVERRGLRRLRRSRPYRAVRELLPAGARRQAWQLATHAPRFDDRQFELSAASRVELVHRLRSDLLALRALMDEDFDAWGLLSDA